MKEASSSHIYYRIYCLFTIYCEICKTEETLYKRAKKWPSIINMLLLYEWMRDPL